MKKIISTFITLKDKEIATLRIDNVDYISLTDLAKFKNSSNPADVINKWMTNKDSFDFYCLWEELFNPDFNLAESREIKTNEVGYNAFTMSPTQWKKRTNAIGIVPSSGKYSIGTFAHPDIALEFSSWIDTAFRLYLIKEFERLKRSEAYQNDITWSIKRELAKTNYLIHTDAIKENIVPILTEKQKLFVYANEADVLNVALFGITAKEWRKQNPSLEGNIRDYASVLQLVVLVNLENLNANMIENNVSQKERLIKLNATAKKQLILLNTENVEKIENK